MNRRQKKWKLYFLSKESKQRNFMLREVENENYAEK